jgi:hypothetical protein
MEAAADTGSPATRNKPHGISGSGPWKEIQEHRKRYRIMLEQIDRFVTTDGENNEVWIF